MTWIQFLPLAVAAAATSWMASPPGDDPAPTDPPAANRLDPDLVRQRDELTTRIQQLWNKQDIAEARKQLEKLLDLYQKICPASQFPHGHIHTVYCYRDLFRASHRLGDVDAQLKWSKEGLDMCRQLFPKDQFPHGHPELAALVNNRAAACFAGGDYEASRVHSLEVAAIGRHFERQTGDNRCRELCVTAYDRIAMTYYQERDFRKVVEFSAQSLELHKALFPSKTFPVGHERLSSTLLMHGRALREAGEYANALEYLQQSHDMYLRLHFFNRNPDLAPILLETLVELGIAHRNLGDYTRATELLEQANVKVGLLKNQTAARILNLRILAELLLLAVADGKFHEAAFLRNALSDLDARMAQEPPTTVDRLDRANLTMNLGYAFCHIGEFDLAEAYLLKSCRLCLGLSTTPKEKHPHPLAVYAVCGLANLYQDMGNYEKARTHYESALGMARTLFPQAKYPEGHRLLSILLQNAATHLWLVGETESAAAMYREALEMNERLYSREEYPAGHEDLRRTYTSWAGVLAREGKLEEAESYLGKAHEIAVSQFPETKYPRGHDELAQSWCDVGRVAQARGDFDKARALFEQALHSYEDRLGQAFPEGHPSIARTLADLGRVSWREGDCPAAKRCFQQSLDMRKRLYPADAFPVGHPLLANALRDLGGICLDGGESDEAYRLFKQAAVMDYEVVASFFGSGSEAELLNLVARRFQSLDLVLNAWRHTDLPATDVYPYVWMRRGLVPRLFACRHQAIQESQENAGSAEYARYVALRRELSRSLFVSVGNDSSRTSVQLRSLHELNAMKEGLERKLAGRIDTAPREAIERNGRFESLVDALPENSVLIDVVRSERGAPRRDLFTHGLRYCDAGFTAFILAPKRALVCVDLGDAAEIEELAMTWQQELASERPPGDTGQRLVRLVWEPLRAHVPAATEVVYVVPDGALCGIPWGALPRPADSGVLLEDFAFAILPSAQFLLDELGERTAGDKGFQRVLAVGAVDYGTADANDPNQEMGLKRVQWPPLEGSRTELDAAVSAAAGRHITLLAGTEATVENVLDHLPEVDCAHLATHGFYVDEQFGSTLELAAIDHGSQALEKNRNRATVLRRNPLVRSGLALAGANQLGGADELGIPREPVGILTADDIATRNCGGLKLVVLSACETGLGDVANADGTLGLQAAFHMAGARNVIASLWKIDDAATAELMAVFYRLLWQENRTPLQALREAQLALLRRMTPTQTGDSRGPDLTTVVPLKSDKTATRTPGAYRWAAFVLSGPGF